MPSNLIEWTLFLIAGIALVARSFLDYQHENPSKLC
jgi:hypothetical protein